MATHGGSHTNGAMQSVEGKGAGVASKSASNGAAHTTTTANSAAAATTSAQTAAPPLLDPPAIAKNPEENCSLFTALLMTWIVPVLKIGRKRLLTQEDMFMPLKHEQSRFCADLLAQGLRKHPTDFARAWAASWGRGYFLGGAARRGVWFMMVISQVLCLRWLVAEVETAFGQDDPDIFPAVYYALALGLSSACQGGLMNHFFLHGYRFGARVRIGATQLIYDKLMRVALSARNHVSLGTILNAASNDTRRLVMFCVYTNFLWLGIIELIVSLAMLYREVGVSALAGVALMLLLMPVQIKFAQKVGQLQASAVAHTDERTRSMGEILKAILLVKLNVYEKSFSDSVAHIRGKEIRELHKSNYAQAVNIAVFFSAPLAATAATFAVRSQVQDAPLDAATAFACLAWANVMMRTLIVLPRGAAGIAEGLVSMRRIHGLLTLEEKQGTPPLLSDRIAMEEFTPATLTANPIAPPHDVDSGDATTPTAASSAGGPPSVAVRIPGTTFTWAAPPQPGDNVQDEIAFPPVLHDIHLALPAGSLTTVVGQVAAGKSSLVSALLGELTPIQGPQPLVQGRLALVPSTAWILNMTLRDNICFGEPFDHQRMQTILHACALDDDVARLPAGLDTEIGEHGTTLSGGQRQRVSLARACYRDADVYLLDDVLSALDARVGRHVFERVLSRDSGLLANKTCLLVTHAEWTLPFADTVVVMNSGRITAQGTHAQLVERNALVDVLRKRTASMESSPGGEGATASEAGPGAEEGKESASGGATPRPRRTSSLTSDGAGGGDGKLVQAEETGREAVTLATYRRYIDNGGGLAKFVAIVLLFVLAQAVRIGADLWLAQWANAEYASLSQLDYFLYYLAIVVTYTLLIVIRTIAFTLFMLSASANLHNRMFAKVLYAPMRFFWTHPTGSIMNRFSKDVDALDKMMVKAATDCVNFLSVCIGGVITIAVLTPFVLIVIPFLLAVGYVAVGFYLASSRQLKRLEAVTRAPIYQYYQDTFNGLESIRSFQAEQRLIKEFEHCSNVNGTAFFLFWGASRFLGVILDSCATVIVLGAALTVALTIGDMNPGFAGIVIAQSLQLTGMFQFSVRMSTEVENYMTSVERVGAYGDIHTEAARQNDTSSLLKKSQWPQQGEVEFQDVVMKYAPDGQPALNQLSFHLRPKEKVGLVGRTGAGKSSVGIALFRIVELAGGRITIDGHDAATVGLDDLRRAVAVIPQDPVLFHGSFRSNLDPFNDYTDEQLWTALERAHMKETVEKLPGRLAYHVAENGDNFSLGERQLTCLARALLRQARIVYLDEATSNVDVRTDQLIQATVRSEFANATVITVAHRLETIIDCSRVFVMHKGRVEESGAPADLLRMDPATSPFAALVAQTGPATAARLKRLAEAAAVSRHNDAAAKA